MRIRYDTSRLRFQLLGKDLQPTAQDHIVVTAQPAEVPVVEQIHNVVGDVGLGAQVRCVRDQATPVVLVQCHIAKRGEHAAAVLAVQLADGNVRYGFRAAVRVEHARGNGLQVLDERFAHRATAEQDGIELLFHAGFVFLYGAVQLQRHQGRETEAVLRLQLVQHAAAWFHHLKIEPDHERSHHHHLACDVLARQAEQRFVPRMQFERLSRQACACDQVATRQLQSLRFAGGTAGVYGERAGVQHKFCQQHFK